MDFLGFDFSPAGVLGLLVDALVVGSLVGLAAVALSAVGPRD